MRVSCVGGAPPEDVENRAGDQKHCHYVDQREGARGPGQPARKRRENKRDRQRGDETRRRIHPGRHKREPCHEEGQDNEPPNGERSLTDPSELRPQRPGEQNAGGKDSKAGAA